MTPATSNLPPELVYVTDDMPGFKRRKHGKGFAYYDVHGQHVKSEKQIARIDALAVPPAYTDVWICPKENGHLQATGRDERGRKQYRYHPGWQQYRSALKFDSLVRFGALLPRIRRRIARSLRAGSADDCVHKDFASAALIRLIDRGHLRIGAAKESVTGAVGATSLKRKNIRLDDSGIHLDYTAKGGRRVRRQLSDRTLQRTLEKIDNLPGRRLFQYRGADGELYPLDSGDVNAWLKTAAGDETVSAKTFRTWAGSLAAFEVALREDALTVKTMCEAAARRLRNTAAICRSSYIHPAIIALTDIESDARKARIDMDTPSKRGLTKAETQMLEFLRNAI